MLELCTHKHLGMDVLDEQLHEPTIERTTVHASGSSETTDQTAIDLVGGPFAVVESDPGELRVMGRVDLS